MNKKFILARNPSPALDPIKSRIWRGRETGLSLSFETGIDRGDWNKRYSIWRGGR